MKSACWLVLALTGCIGDDAQHLPINPGAGGFIHPPGGTGGTNVIVISARVCRVTDLVAFNECEFVDVGGLLVQVNNQSIITNADGTFTVAVPVTPTTPVEVVNVSGLGAVTTTTPFTPSITTFPIIDADVFARALASNFIALPPNTGSILGRVIRNGIPVAGVTVVSAPLSAINPLFDLGAGFGINETGQRGVFFVPGITTGAAALTFSPGETLVSGVPVINGGVTILDSTVLPP
ncbi:MAG: hypothetical protein KF773_01385 [Deltaproteobacteria bacterium]|nr:hypothetical protein [Deltaproteobacteria bacterium]MCW5800844.1 hypothetical protein [Deltaproteobacteria bacterium]